MPPSASLAFKPSHKSPTLLLLPQKSCPQQPVHRFPSPIALAVSSFFSHIALTFPSGAKKLPVAKTHKLVSLSPGPSFLMTASPSSSPGYGHFKSAAAPVSRRRSGSIGFLSRTTTQLETSSSSSLDDPRNQDVHRPPLPAPPDAAKGFFPEASIRSFTNGFESEWSSMRSTSAPDPTAPGRPYPLASTAHVEGCDRMYLVQRHGEGRARSMSTLDNSEYNCTCFTRQACPMLALIET